LEGAKLIEQKLLEENFEEVSSSQLFIILMFYIFLYFSN
jgi:hypothetical protein